MDSLSSLKVQLQNAWLPLVGLLILIFGTIIKYQSVRASWVSCALESESFRTEGQGSPPRPQGPYDRLKRLPDLMNVRVSLTSV